MAFDAMPYHFFERKMKENKNINKNTHHKSYIKVIIVKFTQDTRADIIKEKRSFHLEFSIRSRIRKLAH